MFRSLINKFRRNFQSATINDTDLRINGLKDDLSKALDRLQKVEGDLVAARELLLVRDNELREAVSSYRAVLQKENPEIPEELLNGETVQALDRSLVKAQEMVKRVPSCLSNRNDSIRVPAGSPQRMEPDPESLSAKEKIMQGLNDRAI